MTNRLARESSPYLQQHADNPVDWYPWGEEAFRVARETGKPVLLSIGYSACHWCHVMAHESFEDAATAELMNELFVNIKVDREERPDIDKIYQTAHQLLTQRGGGWPLTMFLDGEDQRPFFGGTYFPTEARYGMPAFGELLKNVASYYADKRDEVRSHGARLLEVFTKLEPAPAGPGAALGAAPLAAARNTLEQTFDRDLGGFGSAPKFPHPTTIDRLLRHWRASANEAEPDIEALFMATLTLTRMAEGGLFDHVGGGFCRYSVDRYWQIPHFEKMLYDNGPLLALYAQAALATGDTMFGDVASATSAWMLTDMRADNGGFFATRDADSEGHEGIYYLWRPEQVRELLGDDYELFARRFGLNQDANFEGQWHLTVRESISDIATATGRREEDVLPAIDAAKKKLLRERLKRVAPGRDEKQLTSWNALAIRGLAIAGRALDRTDLVDAAVGAARFLQSTLFVDGRLLASYKDGEARFPAYLDDHAFLLDALLELLQARWDTAQLEFAVQLAELMLAHFEDREGGAFFFTADDHETLIHRPKPLADEAVPSGNGIAAFALQRLGFLLGDTRYLDAAERTLRASWRAISEYPHGHVSLLSALEEYLDHPEIIVVRGDVHEIARWQHAAARLYAPRRLVFGISADARSLPGALAERAAIDGETVAYRCLGTHCDMPVTTWEALAAQLSGA
ncbi:MAG: thioredoxin domain-containing protein [Gammaproteobacteria bacterium]|nr:thioredoxin domain-containing protein [Gammaproteobacteria bacterium]MDH3363044.1 thioredoxin domain-containing protein [Gammaproteobacteria bacterium]MDH3480628.1 thioredoxin domain-containing protein [Gammaproteobacteria bacterium]